MSLAYDAATGRLLLEDVVAEPDALGAYVLPRRAPADGRV